MLSAIGNKINYLCDSNISAIEKNLQEVVTAFIDLQEKSAAVLKKVDPDDLSKLVSEVSDGRPIEERIVKAYASQMLGGQNEPVEQAERVD